jgi:hypothetical protein
MGMTDDEIMVNKSNFIKMGLIWKITFMKLIYK